MDVETLRLLLRPPTTDDIDEMFAIYYDPRVWTHFPTLRHTERETTARMVRRWIGSWRTAAFGSWIVRLRENGAVIGNGGCTLLTGDADGAAVWNLGYRLDADHHGRGYATEISRAALSAARERAPERPVIAYLVEHNHASAAVAEKVGLRLVHRAPDAGNPDPSVMRLVYADRELSAAQLSTAMR